MVFLGEIGRDCIHLISYFASIPGTPLLRDDANPASWMLECIGAGVQANGKGSAELDFANHFAASPESARLLQELDMEGVTRPSMSLVKVSFDRKHAASSLVQCRFVVARFLKMYWRTPSFSLTCVAILIVQALLLGIILLGADFTTYQGVVSGMGMLYMVVVFDGFVTLNGVIPLASNERASYYRERSSETYSAVWYFVGTTAAEIPLTMVASLLFTAIFYPLVGFSGWDTAALFWLNLWLFGLQQAYVGQLFAYVMPSQEVAVAAGLLFDNILYIFTGYTPPYAMLPDGYKWLYHINPIQFALSAAGALVFADCSTEPEFDQALGAFSNVGPELGCQPMRDAPVSVGNITVKEYAEQTFRMRNDYIAFDFGVTVAYIVVFRLLALLGLRYVRHQKR